MDWYMALLPTLMIAFGVSWLWNIFRDFMSQVNDRTPDIQPVEVVNPHDFRGK